MSFGKTKNIFVIGAAIGVAAVLMLLWQWYVPASFGGAAQVYEVKPGMGASAIAGQLQQKGVIHSAFFFKWYVYAFGQQNHLQAGFYSLSPSLPVAAVAQKIETGDIIKKTATIIEGWDVQDIQNYVAVQGIFSAQDFAAAVKGKNVEGYLFPDTYFIPYGATAADFVAMAQANFNKKMTPDLLAQIAVQKKTVNQIVIMASMLEKEVQTPEDKKIVAGILYKRMQAGIALQVDATVDYATAQKDQGYNTYKYPGLPKGPISNPGMDSIMAAIYPTQSDYWYYLSDPKTHQTIFSKTLEEHNAAVAKYLR